jgi:hypothetical protein
MTMSKDGGEMQPTNRDARAVPLWYFITGLPAVFCYMYVPGLLIVRGNAAATAGNFLAHDPLFRLSIVCELFSTIGFIFLVRAVYRLLGDVDKKLASLMATLVLVSVPISMLNVLNEIAALNLFHGASYLSAIDQTQRNALAMALLSLHNHGVNIAAIFWGLWLFPFGILVIRCAFIPRIFGWLLLVNAFAYPAITLISIIRPSYLPVATRYAIVPELGEVWIVLWLLFKGVNRRAIVAAA